MDDIDVLISAEESTLEQWEPEPLYIEAPPPPFYEEVDEEQEEGSCVIIIDIAGNEEQ